MPICDRCGEEGEFTTLTQTTNRQPVLITKCIIITMVTAFLWAWSAFAWYNGIMLMAGAMGILAFLFTLLAVSS